MRQQTPIPVKPFANFKWQWASFAPTESINDPVVLLGVLFRMRKLEGRYKFSSKEFNAELADLSASLSDSVGIDLASRGGERNVMRNSGQYWKALNLIPKDTHGNITLTDFGRRVADRSISQTEFSALTVMTLRLPNKAIQSEAICHDWEAAGLSIYPLRLILAVYHKTDYLTAEELQRVVIPLSGVKGTGIDTYVSCITDFRAGSLDISSWPDCCPASNDRRMAREFLLFLANYGYLNYEKYEKSHPGRFVFNQDIEEEILSIISGFAVRMDIHTLFDTGHLRISASGIVELSRRAA